MLHFHEITKTPFSQIFGHVAFIKQSPFQVVPISYQAKSYNFVSFCRRYQSVLIKCLHNFLYLNIKYSLPDSVKKITE